ncbi:MAG: CPBP family intramembrane metalloprotease [Lachnospiraceae bacterium]|nr:CPBP family intramembrane metalloprotease [Lachnospiraceae bacterium]
MNSKKANRLFLSVVLMHFVLIFILIVGSQFFSLGIIANLAVSQLVILLPACICVFWGKDKIHASDLGFQKIKISTIFLTILYTLLCMPLVTVVNAISMLFVDNTVVAMSSEVLAVPFPIAFLMIAMVGPFSEEFVFRGIMYHSYRKDGNAMGAIFLSALVFGFMHMNLNQTGYAFVIGIALAFLMIATGSIWASVLMHMIINAQSVCMMFLTEYIMPGSLMEDAASISKQELFITIGIYGIVASVTTVLAVCLLVFIADREGHKEELKNLFVKDNNSKCRISPALIVALLLAFIYMVLEAVATAIMG